MPSPSSRIDAVESRPRPHGRARVFQIAAVEDLLAGDHLDAQLGDYRLDNDRVVAIISALDHPLGMAPSGGHLIGAAVAGGADTLGRLATFLDYGRPLEVVYDDLTMAGDDTAASVTAHGHAADEPDLLVETRYTLRADEAQLEVSTTLTNSTGRPMPRLRVGDTVGWGRNEPFVPGSGFEVTGPFKAAAGWVGGFGDASAYAYVIDAGPLLGRGGPGMSELSLATFDLGVEASASVKRSLAIGRPTDDSVYRSIGALRHLVQQRLTGKLRGDASGRSLAGVRLLFLSPSGPEAVARSDESGYAVALPPGTYRVFAEGLGRRGPEALEIAVGSTVSSTHDVVMSPPGRLQFAVRQEGKPLPARLSFVGLGTTLAPSFGPRYALPGGSQLVTRGDGSIALPPGRYRVVASRGPAFTIDEQLVTVAAGGTARAHFNLRRLAELPGWRCVDPHQHAGGWDAPTAPEDSLVANLAADLDAVVVDSDRPTPAVWQRLAEGLKLDHPFEVIPAGEIWSKALGSVGMIPVTTALYEAEGDDAELVALKGPEHVLVLQRGHLADLMNPSPATIAALAAIDAIEIFPGKDPGQVEPALRRWFSLLGRGIVLTAVGGSSSRIVAAEEIGYPRTCFTASAPPTAESLVAALKRRQTLVTNGPFVRISVAGRGMGQLAGATRGRARVDIEIDAAPWVDVRRLELYLNGTRRGRAIDIPASTRPSRYRNSIELRIDRDAYLVAVVSGDAPLGPLVGSSGQKVAITPLAITNPVFLDRDGDGRWSPPNEPPP